MIKIEITLEEVKEALRIDYDDEDVYLDLCLEAAKVHLEDSIDDYNTKILEEKFQKKAKIVIIMTTQNLFDNRTYSENSSNTDKIKYVIQSFIAQMRWS